MRSLILAAALTTACAATPAPAAVPAATPAATPAPCSSEAHHAFDFWIGDWDVYAPDGSLAGENAITREEYGCLLVEHWVNTAGQTGQSYNFLDPATNKWRQVWVSAGAVIDYSGGLTETGSMLLEGSVTYQAGGPPVPFRGEWTANPDGSVTQHFQQGDPATGEWSDWFVGKYVRKSEE